MSIVKDTSLAAKGRQKIEYVKSRMPVLTGISKELIKEQTFTGLKIGMSIHLEAKTAYLATILHNAGAEVYATGCNPLSTQDDVAAGLAEMGVNVYAIRGVSCDVYEKHLHSVLNYRPDLIIDDGGDLMEAYCRWPTHAKWDMIGGCEETTTGVCRLKQLERGNMLPFPMLNVNDAKCKHYYDNKYGTGQSVLTALMNVTNSLIAGKVVVIAGYGYCGRGIAMRARGMGAEVIVTEVDPVKAIEAVLDGYRVMTMAEAATLGDFFITATGCKDVINGCHFSLMKDNVYLANAGHFDVEINLKDLEKITVNTVEQRDGIRGYRIRDVYGQRSGQCRMINVLAEGRLVNLAAGDGHPAEIMDMSFSLQALGLKYLVEEKGKLQRKVYDVPDEINDKVAVAKLRSMKVNIDKLSTDQKIYLGIL